jgi:hypothetical protein
MVTVCRDCASFVNVEPGSVREHVWYNHRCKAHPLPVGVDPYDGSLKPHATNDLGKRYFTDESLDVCRNHNDGSCGEFEGA